MKKLQLIILGMIYFPALLLGQGNQGVSFSIEQAKEAVQKAEKLHHAGDYSPSLPLINSASKTFEKEKDWENLAICFELKDKVFEEQNYPEEMLKNALAWVKMAEANLPKRKDLLGLAYKGLGGGQLVNQVFDESIKSHIKAADLFSEMKNWDENAIMYIGIAVNYLYLGEYYSMEQALIRADSIGKRYLNDTSEMYSYLFDLYGVLYYDLLGDYDKALNAFVRGLEFKRNNPKSTPRGLAGSYTNIGVIYDEKGDHDKGIEYHQFAIDAYLEDEAPDPMDLAQCYNNLGLSYAAKLDKGKSLFYLRKNLEILEANTSPSSYKSQVLGLNNLGTTYDQFGMIDEAILYLQKAQKLGEKLDFQLDKIYNNLSLLNLKKGNLDQADQYSRLAISKAIEKFDSLHLSVAMPYIHLGEVADLRNRFEEALGFYQKAMMAVVPTFRDSDIMINPAIAGISSKKITLLKALKAKGVALASMAARYPEQNKYAKATLQTFRQAIAMVDTMRLEYGSEGAKKTLLSDARDLYEKVLDFAYGQYHQTQDPTYLNLCFEISEKSKATLLFESLQESQAQEFAGLPDSLVAIERSLKMDIAFYGNKIATEERAGPQADSVKLSLWRNKRFALKASYAALIQTFESQFPAYYQLKYNLAAISLKETQEQILAADEAILSYFLGDSSLYILAVIKDRAEVARVKRLGNFNQDLAELYAFLVTPKSSETAIAEASHRLYQALVSPIESLVAGKSLTIIPDGKLNYLPFEILIKEILPAANGRTMPYLLRAHQIGYAYSATLLRTYLSPVGKFQSEYLAFAPEFSGQSDETQYASRNSNAGPITRDNPAAALHGAKREVALLGNYLTGKTLMGTAATKAAFREEAPHYGILHFATHAIIDDQHPMNSRLLFSPENNEVNVRGGGKLYIDGEPATPSSPDLYVWELYNMKLNAQLAVLSACNTGFGKLERGEGVMSLGRAFAYAGVPSTVMSLWPAEDQATADIMGYFYEGLSKGLAKDEALRAAKLRFLEEAPGVALHPFYWAGFVVQGDTAPLQNSRNWLSWLLFGGGILMVVLLWWAHSSFRA